MSIFSRLSYIRSARRLSSSTHHITCLLIVASTSLIGMTGCGQKGALYLVDNSDQTTIETSSAVLNSGSQPQDTAFDNLDNSDYDKTRYIEQKQILPDVSDDPNDY
ncbi:LPS translocon maturation chaperone LptM [Psychrobacter sp. DM4]|uniref:LPS translocon maturation chaperone LptM n=1 Tax=Psychrobacter sp. DM4 TaxID=3440637 RepID=UPI003F4F7448